MRSEITCRESPATWESRATPGSQAAGPAVPSSLHLLQGEHNGEGGGRPLLEASLPLLRSQIPFREQIRQCGHFYLIQVSQPDEVGVSGSPFYESRYQGSEK